MTSSDQPAAGRARRHPGRLRSTLLACALLLAAALGARMLAGAQLELSRAQEAQARGDRPARLRHLRRAMAYYVPGNPWVRQAHDELLTLARRARRDGRREAALEAYHELRSAILSLRTAGATRPYAGSLPEINRAIAALTSAHPDAAAALRGEAGRRDLLRRLEAPPGPHRGWAALGLLGFLIWVGGACWMLARGLRRDARVVGRRFWPLLALVLLGLGLFCLGLALA